MAAIAMLDLLRKNPNFGGQAFNSRGLFSTKLVGASSAAASFAISTPFAFGAFFGDGASRVSYCDAGIAIDEDYISSIRSASANIFQSDALKYTTKQYDIELKSLFSAFHWKNLAVTSLRSFLLFYLPLLEPKPEADEDDEDFLENPEEQEPLDLSVPFKKSVKQIIRETSVVTTRRVFERLAVHYVSHRMAWKLLKDVPKSAARKAARRLPVLTYFSCVSKTTFRGHLLAVLASWTVQISIDIYHFFASIYKTSKDEEEADTVETSQQVRLLGKRICGATFKCGASLVFASIGAGIGAMFIRPTIGQWIGCGLGDLAGPVVVTFIFEKLNFEL
ncbi:hypothetical protein ABFS82_02G117800 [Erythranthe guttata]|uniref:Uncharacterized protein n=1 Tax=Erythranthe guttata TaxID=4155 RepID=A0A022QHI8_ERYGU|nr:PREDICTED: uncharacterized protein LOC105969556 [Erythranthe guttata]EYU27039.1 hypothetical protein MIMGU_mgv1a009734mg [Erythranthe guttata]|eukprot:XP_012849782.1 PREDICTED: uncharacterized protein LOC105969556 [Erythranthe guttata]